MSVSSLPKITVTSGGHSSIMRAIEEVSEYIEELSEESSDLLDEDFDQTSYWEGIKSQLVDIAKLGFETDLFKCGCESGTSCPFHRVPDRSPKFRPASPNLYRRLSAPVGDRKVDVSYGGFEEHFLKVNKDIDFEIEEDSDQSDGSLNGSSSFNRRRSPALRRKKPPQRPSGNRMSLPPQSLSFSSLNSTLPK